MELPTVLDMLAISVSAGLALEQALLAVISAARVKQGQLRRKGPQDTVLLRELQGVAREVSLGGASVVGAMEHMAVRNGLPELLTFAEALRAAWEGGLPLAATLQVQAAGLREKKLANLREEGGKTTIRILIPVAIFILPVFLVLLLYPAAVQIIGLNR